MGAPYGSPPSADYNTFAVLSPIFGVVVPPAGVVLARMEPTRWGSLLIGAAAVVVPVLILRLGQIWNA